MRNHLKLQKARHLQLRLLLQVKVQQVQNRLKNTTSSQSKPKVDNQTIYSQILEKYWAESDLEKAATVYAFVDLDGDGQNELLMGDQSNRSGYYISGVYMLFQKKQIALLGISYAASGGGARKAVLVYQGAMCILKKVLPLIQYFMVA
ncbi:hypothetical protein [Enterococcus cecorum]|uniref:hypothetical protein n=1 Tax=Enterococcus cecorum TaxID=44008 RepID=UPI00148C7A4C|nr:hypothetical protein [Enterococcus cecorum]